MGTTKLTCTADVCISEGWPGNAYNRSDHLAFGRGGGSVGRYYALLKFDALSLDPNLYEISSAVLTVTKISGYVGFDADFNARALQVTSNWSESTTWNTQPGATTTGQSPAVAVGRGYSGTINFNVTDIVKAWQSGSGQYGVRLQQDGSTEARIKCIADKSSGSGAYITVTWTQREPAPTTPTVTAPGTITSDSKTFGWTASTDRVFASSQLSYELQVSFDGGSTWVATHTTGAGDTDIVVNMRTVAGLKPGQYYYNSSLKVRVRAVTPAFNGTVYRSSWGVSAAGVINYRITPSAPSSVSLSASSVYEGQTLTITLGRPTSYNAYNSSGGVMNLTYTVKLKDGSTLGSVTVASTSSSVGLTVTVPSKTSGMADLSTSITATVTDAHGQASGATSAVGLTIRRFRAPAVTIANSARTETAALVEIQVTDTGYGASQNSGQIAKVEYNLDGGGWKTLSPSWSGLKTSFSLSGLTAGSRYSLQVRVTNAAPSGLSAKTGSATYTVLEHTPAAMIFRDSSNGATGIAAKSGIIGKDWGQRVAEGDLCVEGDLYRIVDGVKEWYNPPMIVGVEYRTTERHNGKVVYAKHISYAVSATIGAAGTASDTDIPHGITDFSEIVRCVGRIQNRLLPFNYNGTGWTSVAEVTTSVVRLRVYDDIWGVGYTFDFDIYYTK